MLLVPIGLKSKIKKPPFLVAGIVVITTLVSMFTFSQLRSYEKNFFDSPEQNIAAYRRRQLFAVECARFVGAEDCKALRVFQVTDRPMSVSHLQRQWAQFVEKYPQPQLREKAVDIFRFWTHLDWTQRADLNRAGAEWKAYQKSQNTAWTELRIEQRARGMLSTINANAWTLFQAQLTHADWFHLCGNMIFLLFFASCVEQMMGWRYTLGLYALGGSIGMFAQVLLAKYAGADGVYIVGASANVFACSGAFMRLFWREPLKIWLTVFLVYNRTLFLPTWCFLVFFVLMSQFEGLSESGSNIAYFAHLVGFAVGALIAEVWIHGAPPMSSSAIFPYEDQELAKARAIKDPFQQRQALCDLLFFCPYNVAVMYDLLDNIARSQKIALSINSQEVRFIEKNLAEIIRELCRNKKQNSVLSLLQLALQIGMEPKALVGELPMQEVLDLSSLFHEQYWFKEARELLKSLLDEASSEQKQFLKTHLQKIKEEESRHVRSA